MEPSTMSLTNTQTQILAAAAAHPHRLALPPERLPAAPRQAVAKSLLKAGFVEMLPVHDDGTDAPWTIDGEPTLLRITEAGLAAIGSGERLAAAEAQDGPLVPVETAGAPECTDTAPTAQEGPQEPVEAVPAGSGCTTLREAATAVLAAWDGPSDRASMAEAIATLRTALAGRQPRPPRQPGAPRAPRAGTKQAQVLDLLRRPEGATVAQIAEATGWQPHTVRGFFAGLKKRQGIEVKVLERIRQVGPGQQGAKGSHSVYRIADAG
jgi:hypothetical protein